MFVMFVSIKSVSWSLFKAPSSVGKLEVLNKPLALDFSDFPVIDKYNNLMVYFMLFVCRLLSI